jgi:hypothetical protein
MRNKPKVGSAISVESAAFLFALASAGLNQSVKDQVIKLALRGPDVIKDPLKNWLISLGVNPDGLGVDLSTPATKEEVKALMQPLLKDATELASLGQIVDTYIFTDLTPDSIVYAFYIGIRFVIAKEKPPTPQESKRIWELTLRFAQTSKLGRKRWKELRTESANALDDWLSDLKESARKKYETFLRQKKTIDANAEVTFKSLVSIFDED